MPAPQVASESRNRGSKETVCLRTLVCRTDETETFCDNREFAAPATMRFMEIHVLFECEARFKAFAANQTLKRSVGCLWAHLGLMVRLGRRKRLRRRQWRQEQQNIYLLKLALKRQLRLVRGFALRCVGLHGVYCSFDFVFVLNDVWGIPGDWYFLARFRVLVFVFRVAFMWAVVLSLYEDGFAGVVAGFSELLRHETYTFWDTGKVHEATT